MPGVRAQDEVAGRTLGEFVLRDRIGQGAFGAVYRATQTGLDREAVVKVLHARLHASQTASERFLREAKLASKLDHPYAAHIYAFGAEPDGTLWIAMELVRGTPLDQVLRLQGPLPLERFVPLFDRICEVVHSAHEQGIVHRDIKPANVMVLSRAGRLLPKLLDLGIAKGLDGDPAPPSTIDTQPGLPSKPLTGDDLAHLGTLDAAAETMATGPGATGPGVSSQELTQRGAIMGTPHYMAPEQWVDAGAADRRSDLYALGVLAYECLTGQPPFGGRNLTELASAHASGAVPALPASFPPALQHVIATVLAKKPDQRYPDVLAFVAAFREAAGIASEATSLPTLDVARRDVALASAPQPIADAVAALVAARNAHQARDALAQLARTIVRYIGLIALACRSRVAAIDEPPAVADALRTLYRRSLSDVEWLELAEQLTRPWLERRDAYPVPELVDALHGERDVVAALGELLALRARDAMSETALVASLELPFATASRVLRELAFLDAYPLVVGAGAAPAELWTGVRRTPRMALQVHGKPLAPGVPALLDAAGAPVLVLAPIVQAAAPTPGAPAELFMFEGRDARGAKLVALPSAFEYHDDELWSWFRTQLGGSIDDGDTAASDEQPPYCGLTAFSPTDSARFFGREKQIDAFVNRLKVQPMLAVVGRSGAGKSSFVYAGVVPALGWRVLAMRPGPAPVANLLATLEHAGIKCPSAIVLGTALRGDAAARGPILLVIDQLEEIFTLCTNAEERDAFAEAIATAARASDDPVRVICTLRDDFLARTEQVPALRNRIAQGLQLLAVPGADDLRRIVVEPARRVGYELEGELADDMVREVADQPGALALISFTASKLWELRDRHFKQLTRTAYKALGGVGGALAHHADETLDALPPEQRALAREAFRHLVTTQNTRAVLGRNDLRQLLGGSDAADRVLETLVAARLLVASENEAGAETIEIVHEALLVTWPRLVGWRREDDEGARFREQLRAAAEQWHERARDNGLLWRGDALADYTRWRARHPGPLTDLERAFGDASLAEAARGRRRRRLLLAGAFATLVAVVVGLVFFNTRIAGQRHELHENLMHQYQDQGRRLLLDGDPLQALAYLDRARELGAAGHAQDFLVASAIRASDGELFEVRHADSVRSPQFSSDGTRLLTAGLDHQARIWDSRTGALVHSLPHADIVSRTAFAPDGHSVLTASLDHTAVLWDAVSGRSLHTFQHDGEVWCALFSPDGKLAVTGSSDGVVATWNVADGSLRFRGHGDASGISSCAVSPDGAWVAAGTNGGTTFVWDLRSGAQLHVLKQQTDVVRAVQFATDSKRLVAASFDGTAVVWDVTNGQPLHVLRHADAVQSAELSRDGTLVLTASDDHTAALWNANTGERLRVLSGHTAGVGRARFSPDGTQVVTASDDATAWLWETATGRVLARWRGHQGRVRDVVFDAHGERVLTAGDDGNAIVWDARPQELVVWLAGHRGPLGSAMFSPDATRVATSGLDGSTRLWDALSGRELLVLQHDTSGINDAEFDADGGRLATGAADGAVRVWSTNDGRLLATLPGAKAEIRQLAWSPDGVLLVAAANDGWIRCWEVATGRVQFEKRGHGGQIVDFAGFDATGQHVITAGNDRYVRIWNRDGSEVAAYADRGTYSAAFDRSGTRVFGVGDQSAEIWSVAGGRVLAQLAVDADVFIGSWSQDGSMVVTASINGAARLWDAETGQQLAVFQHAGRLVDARFSPDGTRVVVAMANGIAAIHELPTRPPLPTALERLLRCRVPYELDGNRLRLRRRDRSACSEPTK